MKYEIELISRWISGELIPRVFKEIWCWGLPVCPRGVDALCCSAGAWKMSAVLYWSVFALRMMWFSVIPSLLDCSFQLCSERNWFMLSQRSQLKKWLVSIPVRKQTEWFGSCKKSWPFGSLHMRSKSLLPFLKTLNVSKSSQNGRLTTVTADKSRHGFEETVHIVQVVFGDVLHILF